LDSVNAADAIVDALEMAAHEEERQEEYQRGLQAAEAAAAGLPSGGARGGLGGGLKKPQKPLANPLLLGLSPAAYVLRCLGNVRANDLEQALLLLPFTDAVRLMRYLAGWLEEEAQVGGGGGGLGYGAKALMLSDLGRAYRHSWEAKRKIRMIWERHGSRD
jgi:U3 small nucleolar RNA-associated protein 12